MSTDSGDLYTKGAALIPKESLQEIADVKYSNHFLVEESGANEIQSAYYARKQPFQATKMYHMIAAGPI